MCATVVIFRDNSDNPAVRRISVAFISSTRSGNFIMFAMSTTFAGTTLGRTVNTLLFSLLNSLHSLAEASPIYPGIVSPAQLAAAAAVVSRSDPLPTSRPLSGLPPPRRDGESRLTPGTCASRPALRQRLIPPTASLIDSCS